MQADLSILSSVIETKDIQFIFDKGIFEIIIVITTNIVVVVVVVVVELA